MKKRIKYMLLAVVLVVFCGFLFRDSLVRTYVKLDHVRLEQYAKTLLAEEGEVDRWGIWEVDCYPEQGVVEFHTWAFGLVPSAVYEGFYYSADNRHHISVIGGYPMEGSGDSATWSDGTDNGGESTRFKENWFWFRAWF